MLDHHPLGKPSGFYRWDTSVEAALDHACALAARNLTKAEWDTFFPRRPYQRTCTADQIAGVGRSCVIQAPVCAERQVPGLGLESSSRDRTGTRVGARSYLGQVVLPILTTQGLHDDGEKYQQPEEELVVGRVNV